MKNATPEPPVGIELATSEFLDQSLEYTVKKTSK